MHRYFGFAIETFLKTFPKCRKCKNFNFLLYPFPAEMLYLQKYLTNFQKLSFGWEMRKVLLWLKISCAQIFWLCNSNVRTFPTSRNLKISIFPFTLPEQKCYIFKKYLTNLQKLILAERWGRWLLWLKISCAQIFWFCNSNVRTFPTSSNLKISIFPFTLSEQKCYIFKSI